MLGMMSIGECEIGRELASIVWTTAEPISIINVPRNEWISGIIVCTRTFYNGMGRNANEKH